MTDTEQEQGKINRIEENTESVAFGLLDGKQRGRYEVSERNR